MKKNDLYPVQEPITIKINPAGVVLMAFIFALVFFLIGIATMHYPMTQMGWI